MIPQTSDRVCQRETITLSAINSKSSDTTAGTDPDGYDDDDRLTYWKRSDNNLTHEWTLTDVGDWSALKTNGTRYNRKLCSVRN